MEIITRQTMADSSAINWGRQYGSRRMDVFHRLTALGNTKSPDMVDAIIGNRSWTKVPECSECGSVTDAVIMVGEAENEAWLCKACVDIAFNELTAYYQQTPLGCEENKPNVPVPAGPIYTPGANPQLY